MNEVFIIGGLWAAIQAGFWLWMKTHLAKQEKMLNYMTQLNKDLLEFKLIVSKEFVYKSDLKDFIERNDKIQSELKTYLMATHDK